jgi:zinc protease
MKGSIWLIILAVGLSVCTTDKSVNQGDLKKPLPFDLSITKGKLENGLAYYIKENQTPSHEVVIWLIVKAGSLLEQEQQRGAAHFIEHMAFHGSNHFKKNEIDDFFRSIGMGTSSDVNAITGFYETIYKISLNTDSPKTIQKGFEVLKSFINGITFDPQEIEKVRKIIIEEWRRGQGVVDRKSSKYFSILTDYSKHSTRMPIGSTEVIKTIKPTELKRFYSNWYQPKRMSIFIVGDINVTDMEKKVRSHFSKIKGNGEVASWVENGFPNHSDTLYTKIIDPEIVFSQILITNKSPLNPYRNHQDFRDFLIEKLYTSMINTRISTSDHTTDCVGIGSGYHINKYSFFKAHEFTINVKNNRFKDCLIDSMKEIERIRQYGFHSSELSRAKKELTIQISGQFEIDKKQTSKELVESYTSNILLDKTILSAESRLMYANKYLPTIKLMDVNEARNIYNTKDNRIITFFGNQEAGKKIPTESEIDIILNEIKSMRLAPYSDIVSDLPFFTKQISPGKIISEKKNEQVGVTTWLLSNRAKVVLKPTDFVRNEILVDAYSPGGFSLIDLPDYRSSWLAIDVFNESGMGPFKKSDLIKRLTQKQVVGSPYISMYDEGFQAESPPENIEVLLQMVHLGFTQPRFDPDIFQEQKKIVKEFINSAQSKPEWRILSQINKSLYPNNKWAQQATLDDIENINFTASKKSLLDRFSSGSDFTFQFVGNFEVEKIKPYILKYLATLPSGKKEIIKDLKLIPPKGKIRIITSEFTENKSEINISLNSEYSFSEAIIVELETISRLIEVQVFQSMRENLGLIYSSEVKYEVYSQPEPYLNFSFATTCNPQNVNRVISEFYKIVDDIKLNPVDIGMLTGVLQSQKRALKESLKENSYWAEKLKKNIMENQNINDILQLKELINKTTPSVVQTIAGKYLNLDNSVIIISNPKKN